MWITDESLASPVGSGTTSACMPMYMGAPVLLSGAGVRGMLRCELKQAVKGAVMIVPPRGKSPQVTTRAILRPLNSLRRLFGAGATGWRWVSPNDTTVAAPAILHRSPLLARQGPSANAANTNTAPANAGGETAKLAMTVQPP